jgi:hypothetical protein
VIKGTQHAIAAAVFAEFLNTDPATTSMFNTVQSLFPSTTALLSSPSFAGLKPAFFGGQQVNQLFAGISPTVNTGFQWPPFLDQAVSDWTSTIGKALAEQGRRGHRRGPVGVAAHHVRQEPGVQCQQASQRKHGRSGYVFAAPFLLCFLLLFILPLGYAAYLSLFKNQLVGGTVFAGLGNYVTALHRRPAHRRRGPGRAVLRDPGAGHAAAGRRRRWPSTAACCGWRGSTGWGSSSRTPSRASSRP